MIGGCSTGRAGVAGRLPRCTRPAFGVVLTLALLVLASCSSAPSGSGRDTQPTATVPIERLAWAGFSETDGVEVLALEEESGLDTAVDFVLRASPADLDRVLEAAQFSESLTDGISVFQPPIEGFDLSTLDSPRSGEDQWRNLDGETIHRKVVRGGLPPSGDAELVHVWAFTT